MRALTEPIRADRNRLGALLATAVLATLGLLLLAGSGPLGPALATFAIGVVVVLLVAVAWRAAARRRRRVALQEAARVAIDAAAAEPGAPAVLRALRSARPSQPVALGAAARRVVARARERGTEVSLVVERDASVWACELEPALAALVEAADGAVSVAVRGARVELRAAMPDHGLAAALARVVAQRAGGDLHVLGGLTVLTFRDAR